MDHTVYTAALRFKYSQQSLKVATAADFQSVNMIRYQFYLLQQQPWYAPYEYMSMP